MDSGLDVVFANHDGCGSTKLLEGPLCEFAIGQFNPLVANTILFALRPRSPSLQLFMAKSVSSVT